MQSQSRFRSKARRETKTQYCTVTLADAIRKYKNKEITIKGLVAFYFQVRLRHGWQMTKTAKQIYTLLGVGRTSFYKAFNALKEEKVVTSEELEGNFLLIRLGSFAQSTIPDSPSTIAEDVSAIPEDVSTIPEDVSTIAENETSKPPENKASSDSPSFIHLYLNFLSTLSQEKRERFKKFCNNKIRQLSFQVNSKTAWLNKHYQEYWEEFENQHKSSLDVKLEEASKDPLRKHQKVQEALRNGIAKEIVYSTVYEANCLLTEKRGLITLEEFISEVEKVPPRIKTNVQNNLASCLGKFQVQPVEAV